MADDSCTRLWRRGIVLWEWRTFAISQDCRANVRSLPLLRLERFTDEYVWIPGVLDTTIKVRAGGLKVKRLLDEAAGIQAWVHLELDLPLCFAQLAALFELHVEPQLARRSCAQGSEVLEALRAAGWRAYPVRLRKERRCYRLGSGRCGCEVEIADFGFGAECSSTVAVTGGDAEVVMDAVRTLGLERCRTSDYPHFMEGAMDEVHLYDDDADRE